MSEGNVELLEQRTRRTVHGDGQVDVVKSVYCARRRKMFTTAECLTCDDCRGELANGILCAGSPGLAPERKGTHLPPSALSVPVREVVNPSLVCVTADASVEQVAELMAVFGIGGMPVVDDAGRPIGLIGERELTEHSRDDDFAGGELVRATAGEWMAPLTCVLTDQPSLADATALLSYEGTHRLPVIDGAGTAIGILTALDVLSWISRQLGYAVPMRLPVEKRAHGPL